MQATQEAFGVLVKYGAEALVVTKPGQKQASLTQMSEKKARRTSPTIGCGSGRRRKSVSKYAVIQSAVQQESAWIREGRATATESWLERLTGTDKIASAALR